MKLGKVELLLCTKWNVFILIICKFVIKVHFKIESIGIPLKNTHIQFN